MFKKVLTKVLTVALSISLVLGSVDIVEANGPIRNWIQNIRANRAQRIASRVAARNAYNAAYSSTYNSYGRVYGGSSSTSYTYTAPTYTSVYETKSDEVETDSTGSNGGYGEFGSNGGYNQGGSSGFNGVYQYQYRAAPVRVKMGVAPRMFRSNCAGGNCPLSNVDIKVESVDEEFLNETMIAESETCTCNGNCECGEDCQCINCDCNKLDGESTKIVGLKAPVVLPKTIVGIKAPTVVNISSTLAKL